MRPASLPSDTPGDKLGIAFSVNRFVAEIFHAGGNPPASAGESRSRRDESRRPSKALQREGRQRGAPAATS